VYHTLQNWSCARLVRQKAALATTAAKNLNINTKRFFGGLFCGVRGKEIIFSTENYPFGFSLTPQPCF
jgi:hypothetical protein